MFAGVLLLLLVCTSTAVAGKDNVHRAGQITAMTQNLYVGAEILGIAAAPGLCEQMVAADQAVKQVLDNDFAQRADALAAVIAAEAPDVLGLQEVFTIVLSDLAGAPISLENYLALLMAALEEQGASYSVAAVRASAPLTVPADSDGSCDPANPSILDADYLGTIIDSDVILCRDGVACSNPSGANFEFNAAAETPAGPIVIERGWVSVVATVKGRNYRVLNTHLEVDSNADFRAVQYLQALELAGTLDFIGADGLPQVVLGDFNSDDNPEPPTCTLPFPCNSSYQVMTAAGFQDAWLLRGGPPEDGFTCCQDADLRNIESNLTARIDQVWARGSTSHYGGPEVRGVRARVLGTEQSDRSLPDGLWPSDHAGVSADLVLRSPK
jgi:endonuclease/exonuclease/phosphatase family metal-dependent hydrolase